jgi:CRP-like cAMP-binding protein
MIADQRTVRNGLLKALSPDDFRLLQPHLEAVRLAQGEVFAKPDQPVEHVYFFEEGLSSEIASNPDGERIEVGCFGREGMSPPFVIYGVDRAPHQSLVQVGGMTWRLPAAVLTRAMEESRSLRTLLLRFALVQFLQVAQTTIADGRYDVPRRLARWILMCQDRLGDHIPLTHEFLALMLGVRRAGVTTALHILEGEHSIRSDRGRITVRDREKLLLRAGGCYGVPEAEYKRLIG